eukprot:TRINITY_DN2229_c0_g1_i1.p1 TRINITY_DN2229_c0_g1~~TRINITY_DN2229_c0_g1_i1.p1  ORF type:complete len:1660 (+),score=573.93 TRINITY_DN2229_c0_g1_i1:66-4982(+)
MPQPLRGEGLTDALLAQARKLIAQPLPRTPARGVARRGVSPPRSPSGQRCSPWRAGRKAADGAARPRPPPPPTPAKVVLVDDPASAAPAAAPAAGVRGPAPEQSLASALADSEQELLLLMSQRGRARCPAAGPPDHAAAAEADSAAAPAGSSRQTSSALRGSERAAPAARAWPSADSQELHWCSASPALRSFGGRFSDARAGADGGRPVPGCGAEQEAAGLSARCSSGPPATAVQPTSPPPPTRGCDGWRDRPAETPQWTDPSRAPRGSGRPDSPGQGQRAGRSSGSPSRSGDDRQELSSCGILSRGSNVPPPASLRSCGSPPTRGCDGAGHDGRSCAGFRDGGGHEGPPPSRGDGGHDGRSCRGSSGRDDPPLSRGRDSFRDGGGHDGRGCDRGGPPPSRGCDSLRSSCDAAPPPETPPHGRGYDGPSRGDDAPPSRGHDAPPSRGCDWTPPGRGYDGPPPSRGGLTPPGCCVSAHAGSGCEGTPSGGCDGGGHLSPPASGCCGGAPERGCDVPRREVPPPDSAVWDGCDEAGAHDGARCHSEPSRSFGRARGAEAGQRSAADGGGESPGRSDRHRSIGGATAHWPGTECDLTVNFLDFTMPSQHSGAPLRTPDAVALRGGGGRAYAAADATMTSCGPSRDAAVRLDLDSGAAAATPVRHRTPDRGAAAAHLPGTPLVPSPDLAAIEAVVRAAEATLQRRSPSGAGLRPHECGDCEARVAALVAALKASEQARAQAEASAMRAEVALADLRSRGDPHLQQRHEAALSAVVEAATEAALLRFQSQQMAAASADGDLRAARDAAELREAEAMRRLREARDDVCDLAGALRSERAAADAASHRSGAREDALLTQLADCIKSPRRGDDAVPPAVVLPASPPLADRWSQTGEGSAAAALLPGRPETAEAGVQAEWGGSTASGETQTHAAAEVRAAWTQTAAATDPLPSPSAAAETQTDGEAPPTPVEQPRQQPSSTPTLPIETPQAPAGRQPDPALLQSPRTSRRHSAPDVDRMASMISSSAKRSVRKVHFEPQQGGLRASNTTAATVEVVQFDCAGSDTGSVAADVREAVHLSIAQPATRQSIQLVNIPGISDLTSLPSRRTSTQSDSAAMHPDSGWTATGAAKPDGADGEPLPGYVFPPQPDGVEVSDLSINGILIKAPTACTAELLATPKSALRTGARMPSWVSDSRPPTKAERVRQRSTAAGGASGAAERRVYQCACLEKGVLQPIACSQTPELAMGSIVLHPTRGAGHVIGVNGMRAAVAFGCSVVVALSEQEVARTRRLGAIPDPWLPTPLTPGDFAVGDWIVHRQRGVGEVVSVDADAGEVTVRYGEPEEGGRQQAGAESGPMLDAAAPGWCAESALAVSDMTESVHMQPLSALSAQDAPPHDLSTPVGMAEAAVVAADERARAAALAPAAEEAGSWERQSASSSDGQVPMRPAGDLIECSGCASADEGQPAGGGSDHGWQPTAEHSGCDRRSTGRSSAAADERQRTGSNDPTEPGGCGRRASADERQPTGGGSDRPASLERQPTGCSSSAGRDEPQRGSDNGRDGDDGRSAGRSSAATSRGSVDRSRLIESAQKIRRASQASGSSRGSDDLRRISSFAADVRKMLSDGSDVTGGGGQRRRQTRKQSPTGKRKKF